MKLMMDALFNPAVNEKSEVFRGYEAHEERLLTLARQQFEQRRARK